MEYPPGLPNHLKPAFAVVRIKAGRAFPKPDQTKERIKQQLFALCEIACQAVEAGQWRVDLALDAIGGLARWLCAKDSVLFLLNPVDSGELTKSIMSEIWNSEEWLGYIERLDKMGRTGGESVERKPATTAMTREDIQRVLEEKGWSIPDWANEAKVAYHTAADYLAGKKNPFSSTRAKLAKALGVPTNSLPK